MPSIHYLNPPPHPFWDFVAGIEDHPFFAAYAHPPGHAFRGDVNSEQPRQPEATQPAPEQTEKAKDKQPTVEDPPEVDPSAVTPEQVRDMPFRGRGRFSHAFAEGGEEGRRGHGCRGRGGHRGPPPFGVPQFMFGPPWARSGPRHGPHHGPHHGPPHGRHHNHGPPPPPEGARGPSPPNASERGFDVGQFLNNLGERLGVDLAGAAENLGLDKYTAPKSNNEVDFEPRADIFDTAENYTIHLSLPGAKKEDIGVDWDGENSILRIAGVVHRPGVDEQMLAQLVVNGRKRENGVFEKGVCLGTKRDPASIDVAGITAKVTDGVLVMKVPKAKVEHKTREVPISGSGNASPAHNEKDLLFDADEEMYDAPSAPAAAQTVPEPANRKDIEAGANHEKEAEARDDRSETVAREEQLPRYEVEQPAKEESDWEKDDSDEEGDYVKISVD